MCLLEEGATVRASLVGWSLYFLLIHVIYIYYIYIYIIYNVLTVFISLLLPH